MIHRAFHSWEKAQGYVLGLFTSRLQKMCRVFPQEVWQASEHSLSLPFFKLGKSVEKKNLIFNDSLGTVG
jgi:hypothetical protein